MGALIKLLKIFPTVAIGIADQSNGKKTIIGLIPAAAGAGMLFIPLLEPMAVDTIITGAVIAMGGVTHKVIKAKKKNAEKSAEQE